MTPAEIRDLPRDQRAVATAQEYDRGGYTYETLAQAMKVASRNVVARLIYDARHVWGYDEQQTAPAESSDTNTGAGAGVVVSDIIHENGAQSSAPFSSYVFRRVDFEQYAIPRYTGHERLEGDWCLVSDVHLPFTDWNLAYKVRDVAEYAGIKNLLIVGDWVNFDAFSHYDPIVPGVPLGVELQASVHLAEYYAAWFDRIVMVLGNHEQRLMKATKAQVDHTALGHLLSASGSKLQLSPYSYAEINSGGHIWRATHARNYSRIKGRIADELAQKYQQNIVIAHQHHSGVIMDRYGRYTCVDMGGLHEQEMIAYAQLDDSTSPNMTKGFCILKDGTGHLLTPYHTFTDWTHWLGGTNEQRSAAA